MQAFHRTCIPVFDVKSPRNITISGYNKNQMIPIDTLAPERFVLYGLDDEGKIDIPIQEKSFSIIGHGINY